MYNKKSEDVREWWEKPGFSIQYQIESRPGWLWNRNYVKFNTSMMDDQGNLQFNGPFCTMQEWVKFSKKVGVDYHVFESKWHDGICYWNSKLTRWKTPIDYCKIFAEESKKAGIPFLFYYSNIFDHNPQFDEIQPVREITPSFIAMHGEDKKAIAEQCLNFIKLIWEVNQAEIKEREIPYEGEFSVEGKFYQPVEYHEYHYNPEKYERYLLGQMKELIDTYEPDGMWMDWYWNDASTSLIMEFMQKNYPNTVLAFNMSIDKRPKYAHYLAGEAHDVNTAWKNCQRYRHKNKPWELCGPAAYEWDLPIARPDPHEIFRIASIVMASGGKYCFGLPSQMNGELYPEPAQNVELFGKWYEKRRKLFREAIPMSYKGESVPGVAINDPHFGSIGTEYYSNRLVHVINFTGFNEQDISITFSQQTWGTIEKACLEPDKKELPLKITANGTTLSIAKKDIDLADTILNVVCNKSPE